MEYQIPTMLIPGSVWERADKQSIVLHITNLTVSEQVRTKFPPQVVFLTESGAILSQPIEVFTAKRDYIGVDEHRADLLVALMEGEHEDEVTELPDIDSLPEDSEPVQEPSPSNDSWSVPVSTISPGVVAIPTPLLRLNVGDHPLAELLQESFVSYSETPFHTDDTLHKLEFILGPELTLEALRSVFLLSDPEAVQSFAVTSNIETTSITVSAYVATYLSADRANAYGTVHLLSDGDFRPTVTQELPIYAHGDNELDTLYPPATDARPPEVEEALAPRPTAQVEAMPDYAPSQHSIHVM